MSQNVVVIGGGPAGIEASRRLRDLGYIPILIEKEPVLGGHLARWDRLFPDGVEAHTFLDPMLSDLDGIKYFTDTEVSSINRLKDTWMVKLSNGLSAQVKAILLTTGFDLFKAEKKEEYGYSYFLLSEKSGVPVSTIQKILTGENKKKAKKGFKYLLIALGIFLAIDIISFIIYVIINGGLPG